MSEASLFSPVDLKKARVCVYCGTPFELHREHVIPASSQGERTYDRNLVWIVPGCAKCNNLAGSTYFNNIPDKAAYIANRYRAKYRSLLTSPRWTAEDLVPMKGNMKRRIKRAEILRAEVERRIIHLDLVSGYPDDYGRSGSFNIL